MEFEGWILIFGGKNTGIIEIYKWDIGRFEIKCTYVYFGISSLDV